MPGPVWTVGDMEATTLFTRVYHLGSEDASGSGWRLEEAELAMMMLHIIGCKVGG